MAKQKRQQEGNNEQKAEAQQKFMQVKMLLHQLQNGEKQIETFDSQLTELNSVKEGLEELKNVPVGKDVYVPVSGGIFMRATVKDPEHLLVNVGANTAVTKTIPDTVRLIEEQILEINNAKTQLAGQTQLIRKHLNGMQKELAAVAEREE